MAAVVAAAAAGMSAVAEASLTLLIQEIVQHYTATSEDESVQDGSGLEKIYKIGFDVGNRMVERLVRNATCLSHHRLPPDFHPS
eukprot:SAG11_NODE_4913_length_1724_cov_2.422769_1_plen_84_part_00